MDTNVVNALINVFPWIIPECILGAFACVLFLGSTFKADRKLWGATAIVGLILAFAALISTSLPTFSSRQAVQSAMFAGPLWLDPLALLVKGIALAGGVVLVLFTWDEMPEDQAGEYHGCMLVIVAGMCFTATANDLIVLFLALELISIPTYVLLYLTRIDPRAQEAGLKYFMLSIFSSALLLFGFSYLYGITGTTNIRAIAEAMTLRPNDAVTALPGIALIALVMIVAGLGFKITAVPFHFYAPDVYQGTSLGGAALLAFVPKVAGFVALIRVLNLLTFRVMDSGGVPVTFFDANVAGDGGGGAIYAAPLAGDRITVLLWIVAAVTMTLGNVLALLQDNIKRLLAYSSVAHAGYMLIGLTITPYMIGNSKVPETMQAGGVTAVLFYLVSYGAMTIGAFGVLSYLSTKEREVETVDDLAGLSKSHPGMALIMALFLFSLIGIPITAGFIGKFLLFIGAFAYSDRLDPEVMERANLFRILALIAAVNAAIGGWYYLRMIAVMYLRTPLKPLEQPKFKMGLAAIAICALATLILGVYPKPLVESARNATSSTVVIPEKTAEH